MGMQNLQCVTRKYGDLITVVTTGDVDYASSGALWNELHAQLVPASALGLECTGITFMDSMGLQVLLRAQQHATEQQASFALIGASEYVDRVLELTGLTDAIPHFADVETARATLCPAVG
jgi:anti-anti-sigma factor